MFDKAKKALKNAYDTWVLAKDKPKGELCISAPGGKIAITVDIASEADAAKFKKLVSLVLNSDDEYESYIGGTD